MPSSFDAMHDETRPLRMLEEPQGPSPVVVTLASLMLVLLPVLAVILL
jgi:hypothetical protein